MYVRCPAAPRVQAHGLGTCMECRRSNGACWLTFRTPSCGRSRSAMSPMTTEKGKAAASAARERQARVIAHGGERQDGDREQRYPDGAGNAIPQAGDHPFRVEVDHLI